MPIKQFKQILADLPDEMPVWLWHAKDAYNTESKAASTGYLIDTKGHENDYPMVIDLEDWEEEEAKELFVNRGEVLLVR